MRSSIFASREPRSSVPKFIQRSSILSLYSRPEQGYEVDTAAAFDLVINAIDSVRSIGSSEGEDYVLPRMSNAIVMHINRNFLRQGCHRTPHQTSEAQTYT